MKIVIIISTLFISGWALGNTGPYTQVSGNYAGTFKIGERPYKVTAQFDGNETSKIVVGSMRFFTDDADLGIMKVSDSNYSAFEQKFTLVFFPEPREVKSSMTCERIAEGSMNCTILGQDNTTFSFSVDKL